MDKLIVDTIEGVRNYFYIGQNNSLFWEKEGKVMFSWDNALDFDGCVDATGIIWLCFSCLDGNLELVKIRGDKAFKKSVLKSRDGSGKIDNIKISVTSGVINLWYCLGYDNKTLLVYQVSSGQDNIKNPEAIDYLDGKGRFSLCTDRDLNTHVFYTDSSNKAIELVYLWSKKEIGEKYVFEDIENVYSRSCVCSNGDIHHAFVAKKSDYYGVYYRKNRETPISVGFGVGAMCEPSVIAFEDKIYIQWRDNFQCVECQCISDGKFSTPKVLNNVTGEKNRFCGYRGYKNYLRNNVDMCLVASNGKIFHDREIEEFIKKTYFSYNLESEMKIYKKEKGEFKSPCLEERVGDLEKKIDEILKLLNESKVADEKNHLNEDNVMKIDSENMKLFNSMDIEGGFNDEGI